MLVHAAAGGVGFAAIQLARALQGRVLATAGSPFKRSVVRNLGAQVAVNSRDSVFVSDIAQLGGVDVVLNSLTSSGFVAGSLACLKRGGRFIEISKRDIWSAARVAQDRPDVGYSLVAVDFLPATAVHSSMARLAAQLAAGTVQPLPQVSHTLNAVTAALRQMSQARHIGKIVVRSPTALALSEHPGAVVVTGGLGSLGSLTAAWMSKAAAAGVEIVATGRTGRFAPLAHSWQCL